MTDQLLELALMLHPEHDRATREHLARLAGRLGYVAVHVPVGCPLTPDELETLVVAADPARVIVDVERDEPGRVRSADVAVVQRARRDLDVAGDPRRLVVDVPISIGRTRNEAVARADREPRFAGEAHPERCGVFGTFEQAQVQVLGLAHAGADVLLVTVPDERDVADVLAQVKALMVGATPALFRQAD
jgi:hypothetical protein